MTARGGASVRGGVALTVQAVLLVLVVSGAGGQGAGQPRPAPDPGSAAPYLAPDHWAMRAFRRLEAAGLLPAGYDPGVPGLDRVTAASMLQAALEASRTRRPGLVDVVQGYVERFDEGFPVARRRVDGLPRAWERGQGAISTGLTPGADELLSGEGLPPDPAVPPELRSEDGAVTSAVDVSGYGGRHWAARAAFRVDESGERLGETYVAADFGRVDLWAGRRHLRLAYGDEGVALSPEIPVDGVGVAIEPFRLPWVLEALGTIRLATVLARLERIAPFDDPTLWLFRATVQPHPRFTLGLNRAATAVAVDGDLGDRLKQVAYIAIGKHGDTAAENWRDNQIATVDLRYRPPIPALPLSLYLEWGLEDSAGAWREIPGVVAGAYLGAVPGVPWLAAGVEHASFSERCCGNPWWYRHSGFDGGWTDARNPLGHSLGGHGTEWAVRADAVMLRADLLLGARLYRRERRSENLFAPAFEGESTGGSIELSARLTPALELGLESAREWLPGDVEAGRTEVAARLIF